MTWLVPLRVAVCGIAWQVVVATQFDTPTPPNQGNGADGYRHDDLPQLFGRNAQLPLHGREQHWLIWNHHAGSSGPRCLQVAHNDTSVDDWESIK